MTLARACRRAAFLAIAFSAAGTFASGATAQGAAQPVPTSAASPAAPAPADGAPGPMRWADLGRLPKTTPTRHIPYGRKPSQFVELWEPDGLGPHPTVIMIHGGCWRSSVGLDVMNPVAADLQQRGVAVWNVEYRRLGESGGGYPGTYTDVAKAVDLIRTYGPPYGLDLKHVVLVGHSAGGQLALWAAGRARIAASSPLHAADPLRIRAVVDLAGVADLQRDTRIACGSGVLRPLVGSPSPARPNVFADTSPAAMLPLHVTQVVIHGAQDDTVPPELGRAYVRLAKAAHDPARFLSPPGGHIEEVAPHSAAWAAEVEVIRSLAGAPAAAPVTAVVTR